MEKPFVVEDGMALPLGSWYLRSKDSEATEVFVYK